jgi:hypothetical protein
VESLQASPSATTRQVALAISDYYKSIEYLTSTLVRRRRIHYSLFDIHYSLLLNPKSAIPNPKSKAPNL